MKIKKNIKLVYNLVRKYIYTDNYYRFQPVHGNIRNMTSDFAIL